MQILIPDIPDKLEPYMFNFLMSIKNKLESLEKRVEELENK